MQRTSPFTSITVHYSLSSICRNITCAIEKASLNKYHLNPTRILFQFSKTRINEIKINHGLYFGSINLGQDF